MGQDNSNKISHKLEDMPNTFRDDQLQQILNDINEEEVGLGFSEVSYVAATPFVAQILTWQDNNKLQKRSVVNFTYSPLPFVTLIVKQIFDDYDDSITVATLTATVNYNTNKTVKSVDIVTSRP